MDSSQIRDSKYCMLEILRSAYLRSEAVTTMQGLNKRFLKLSTDDYLDNFNDTMDTMYIEVRCADHLDYLQKAIKYVNLMKGNECLKVDFYYDFKAKPAGDEQSDLDEYDRIVDILTSARAYKKLTIGIDELHAKNMPPAFFTKLINAMKEKQQRVGVFEVDLQYYGHKPREYQTYADLY